MPQGSILGPLVLIYTHDLPYAIEGPVECDQFADDTALISIHDQGATALRNLKESVDRTSLWLQEWRLLVNIAKTHVMEISRRTMPYPEPQITLGYITLARLTPGNIWELCCQLTLPEMTM